MILRNLKSASLLLAGAFFLASCGGGGQQTEETTDDSQASAEFDQAKTEVISGINQVIKDLPPPSEVPYLLMATGSDFDPNLVNPLDKLDSYTSPASKAAMNLGVYTTDVGYLASYEKAQPSLEYVSACQKLAESLGIASAMDIELIGRFERNLNDKDSLKILVDEVLARTGQRLDAMDRLSIAGLVLGGTYTEGLYISTTLIENYPDDLPEETSTLILEPLIKIVIDQGQSLDDLIKVMDDLGENEDINALKVDLQAINQIYDTELAEVSKQISENTGDLVLTRAVLANLTDKVQEIRGKIVE
jgi:hypothetical protein